MTRTPYVTIKFIHDDNNIANTIALYDDNNSTNIVMTYDNEPIYNSVIPVSGITSCYVRTYNVHNTHVC